MPIDLFQPFRIGNLELRNRFVRSATWDATADESGAVTDKSVTIYRELGEGGIGLIISGYAFVSPLGKARFGQYGVHSDDMLPGLSRLAQAAHDGGARIALQIVHAGINSEYLSDKGIANLAVSEIERITRPHREMTDEDIEAILDDFVAATLRARKAGFDAIQFHAAHGYQMSQFISPRYNHRTDKWGGSPENRRRFHLEVIERTRRAVGADFPLLIKFGVMDDKDGGMPLSEGLEAARLMAEKGLDAIEVSAGTTPGALFKKTDDPENVYFRDRTAALKHTVSVPVIAVGGIRSLETAGDIVDSGDADLISMCRPFLREPGLINRWQSGDTSPAKCICCNRCMGTSKEGETVECKEERRLREEATAS